MPTATNDIIRTVCGYAFGAGGRPMSNVLHFKDIGAGNIPDATLLSQMGIIIEGIFGVLAVEQSDRLVFTNYSVQNVTQGIIIGTAPWPTLTFGLLAAEIDVSQAVGLLRMITPRAGVQGRVNLVGLPETRVVEGIIAVTFLTAALVVGANLLATFPVAASTLAYTVYNTVLTTDNRPTSTAIGTANRILGKRKVP